jgi:outer membrane receptor protein involved in Fe transport
VAAISQVQRSAATSGPAAYQIQQVTVLPINVANENVDGILASLHYRYDMGHWGALGFQAQYNVLLNHKFQQYPFDPTIDYLRNPYYSSEFKNIGNASLTWDIDKFSSTLFFTRYGRTPNYYAQVNLSGYATPCSTAGDGYTSCAGTVGPWMIYNASVSYDITDDMRISGIVNNLQDKKPPYDSTYVGAPYFNIFNYNNYGRSYWIEFDWRFGRSGKD